MGCTTCGLATSHRCPETDSNPIPVCESIPVLMWTSFRRFRVGGGISLTPLLTPAVHCRLAAGPPSYERRRARVRPITPPRHPRRGTHFLSARTRVQPANTERHIRGLDAVDFRGGLRSLHPPHHPIAIAIRKSPRFPGVGGHRANRAFRPTSPHHRPTAARSGRAALRAISDSPEPSIVSSGLAIRSARRTP